MRTCQPDGSVEFILSSNFSDARTLQDLIEKQLRQCRYDDKEIFGIRLALEEAIVNAIKHGNQMDPGKRVHVRYRILPDRFEVGITDEGRGYHLDDVPDPLADENLQRPSGRGLLLMKHYMTEVIVHPPGNRLTMCKLRKPAFATVEARR